MKYIILLLSIIISLFQLLAAQIPSSGETQPAYIVERTMPQEMESTGVILPEKDAADAILPETDATELSLPETDAAVISSEGLAPGMLSYKVLGTYLVRVFSLDKAEDGLFPYSLALEFEDGALFAMPCGENLSHLKEGDTAQLQEIEVQTAEGSVTVWAVNGCCVEEPDWVFP